MSNKTKTPVTLKTALLLASLTLPSLAIIPSACGMEESDSHQCIENSKIIIPPKSKCEKELVDLLNPGSLLMQLTQTSYNEILDKPSTRQLLDDFGAIYGGNTCQHLAMYHMQLIQTKTRYEDLTRDDQIIFAIMHALSPEKDHLSIGLLPKKEDKEEQKHTIFNDVVKDLNVSKSRKDNLFRVLKKILSQSMIDYDKINFKGTTIFENPSCLLQPSTYESMVGFLGVLKSLQQPLVIQSFHRGTGVASCHYLQFDKDGNLKLYQKTDHPFILVMTLEIKDKETENSGSVIEKIIENGFSDWTFYQSLENDKVKMKTGFPETFKTLLEELSDPHAKTPAQIDHVYLAYSGDIEEETKKKKK